MPTQIHTQLHRTNAIHQLCHVPILTNREEKKLFMSIERLTREREGIKQNLPSNQHASALQKIEIEMREIRNRIVVANQRLLVKLLEILYYLIFLYPNLLQKVSYVLFGRLNCLMFHEVIALARI